MGVDETAFRKRRDYVTMVTDHEGGGRHDLVKTRNFLGNKDEC